MSHKDNRTKIKKKQIEKEIKTSKKIIRANYMIIMKPSKFINPHKIYKLYLVIKSLNNYYWSLGTTVDWK